MKSLKQGLCVLCEEPIWNPVPPKFVIREALSFLEIKLWDKFLEDILIDLYLLKKHYSHEKILYYDSSLDITICWGCIFELVYKKLKKYDKKAAEEFKKYADPTGL